MNSVNFPFFTSRVFHFFIFLSYSFHLRGKSISMVNPSTCALDPLPRLLPPMILLYFCVSFNFNLSFHCFSPWSKIMIKVIPIPSRYKILLTLILAFLTAFFFSLIIQPLKLKLVNLFFSSFSLSLLNPLTSVSVSNNIGCEQKGIGIQYCELPTGLRAS